MPSGESFYKFALIADLDRDAIKDKKTWKSLLLHGSLSYNLMTSQMEINFTENDNTATEVDSKYNYGGRGMELSDLITFNGKLYTVCDKTGIVYEIIVDKMVPWVILSSGDGNQEEGFKGEWMTVYNNTMVIGGHGKELLDKNDNTRHRDYMWVKTISSEGKVQHFNWQKNFNAMREKAGCSFPGYLTHESGAWSDVHKSWFFLPRKASTEPYDHKRDETMGTNLLIKCSEDFTVIEVIKVGELIDRRRVFSSFKFLPGTNDDVIVAIRSEEVGDKCRTHMTVFTVDGKILMEDRLISDNCKYEGLEFVQ